MPEADPPLAPAPRPSPEDALDWGPPLRRAYPGTRVRAAVLGPRRVRVAWEDDGGGATGWRVTARDAAGRELADLGYEADADGCWLTVPADTRGAVTVTRRGPGGDAPLGEVAFATPPDAPAEAGEEERWARLGAGGLEPVGAPAAGRMHALAPSPDVGSWHRL